MILPLLILHSTRSHATLPLAACAQRLDTAVTHFNDGNTNAAADLLNAMLEECSQMPQLHHNLGVIAGAKGLWPASSKHFQQALSLDSRVSDTLHQLQSVHRHSASVAYREALDFKGKLEPPTFEMQNSATIDTEADGTSSPALRTVSTVDYELYDWWLAAADNNKEQWLAHYISGYPPLENTDAPRVNWSAVQRDISFTAQDAVVVIRYRIGKQQKHTLLLMKLHENRWKIYREAHL